MSNFLNKNVIYTLVWAFSSVRFENSIVFNYSFIWTYKVIIFPSYLILANKESLVKIIIFCSLRRTAQEENVKENKLKSND